MVTASHLEPLYLSHFKAFPYRTHKTTQKFKKPNTRRIFHITDHLEVAQRKHNAKVIQLSASAVWGVSAHTWLEALRSIGSNGAFTGETGYPRGFVARTDPAFSDNAATYRITAKDASTPLCHPAQQVANGYANPQFPRLNASAGSFVALTYQENGHVSAPQVPVQL